MSATAASEFDSIVVGGGFFGCEIARTLAERGQTVALLERAPELLTRASYNNQARIHGGYHYPRSVLTAARSRANYHRFMADYAAAVMPGFAGYYAVARENSKVTADQFRLFMERVQAPLEEAPAAVKELFDPAMIEGVWRVDESVFDAAVLRRLVRERLPDSVAVRTGAAVERLRAAAGGGVDGSGSGPGSGPGSGSGSGASAGGLLVELTDGSRLAASQAYLCLYSMTNSVLAASGLPLIPLKHEMAELALVQPPAKFPHNAGITLMCGPFFSLMPFPDKGCHSLSHVRYTPHHEWQDADGQPYVDGYTHAEEFRNGRRKSHFPQMARDASRFMPSLADCRYAGDSLWEVKTVLPASEADDSRPILMRRDHGLPGLHCVLGAKIDNIYDVLAEI